MSDVEGLIKLASVPPPPSSPAPGDHWEEPVPRRAVAVVIHRLPGARLELVAVLPSNGDERVRAARQAECLAVVDVMSATGRGYWSEMDEAVVYLCDNPYQVDAMARAMVTALAVRGLRALVT